MTPPDQGAEAGATRQRYGRDTVELARVANLSDALFAIAMTLLVLRIDVPPTSLPKRWSGAIVDQMPQMIAFVLSFAVVANFWWIHHRFFALLSALEPGLIVMNLALLGAVALVPVPTSLIGNDPTARAAVLPYLWACSASRCCTWDCWCVRA